MKIGTLVIAFLSLAGPAFPQTVGGAEARARERSAARELAAHRLELLSHQREAADRQRELTELVLRGPGTARLEAEIQQEATALGALQAEKERVLLELLSGSFCSKCERSATEIERVEEKPFAQHLQDVSGERRSASPELIERKVNEYDTRLGRLETEIRTLVERRLRQEAEFQAEARRSEQSVIDARRRLAELEFRASLTYRDLRRARAELQLEALLSGSSTPAVPALTPEPEAETSPSFWLADADGSGAIEHEEGVGLVRDLGGEYRESAPGRTRFEGLTPESIEFLRAAAEATRLIGHEFIVTGAAERDHHSPTSRHYSGDAIDLSARDPAEALALRDAVRQELVRRGFTLGSRPGEVEVEIHGPPLFAVRHVHLEYNR